MELQSPSPHCFLPRAASKLSVWTPTLDHVTKTTMNRRRCFTWSVLAFATAALCCLQSATASDPVLDAEKVELFESRIRPILVAHCSECHSAKTQANGGLLLDSRGDWQVGGDSGPAIVPGKSSESLLIQAIKYADPDLQMPPDRQLPVAIVKDFEMWIDQGAIDPREPSTPAEKKQIGLPVEQAHEHWAYRALEKVEPPRASEAAVQAVDAFIEHGLAERSLAKAPAASPPILVRRLYFDLTGLPPTAEELGQGVDLLSKFPHGYMQLVDRLLNTAQFGENFARKWMDVARYADSITLRGFVLPEAWRYRDYLVTAFAQDRPFDQMIREQVAGDLMQHDDLDERHKQLVATGFLVLGNSNLEQQDKTQLEMDFIDEQLEVIGRAFLGQTIGCARCHDHKFDPIPTRDYYAMAGILRSAVSLRHENVSKWIEMPLPLQQEEDAIYQRLSEQLVALDKQIAKLGRLAKRDPAKSKKSIPLDSLPGIIIDDTQAKLVGKWNPSVVVGPFVGEGYLFDGAKDSTNTATFEPEALPPGDYEVRLAYTASSNRATNALVRVFSADGEATRRINQTLEPENGPWVTLGRFRFEKDGQAFVLVSSDQTSGCVVVDAIQFLNVSTSVAGTANGVGSATDVHAADSQANDSQLQAENQAALAKKLESLEAQKKELEARLAGRPKFMTLVEELPPSDIPIHIRGDVHNLGKTVPRGFLTAINRSEVFKIAPDSSGRLELAQWLSSSQNPLTARVYANRVWSWLMGQGLVPSMNNFGTTGMSPTHPELLDWLANELIENNWSTKHLVRTIVASEAYRRQVVDPDEVQSHVDPTNTFYWRGHSRRLSAEAIRDAMLAISGELDETVGGSLIKPGTKADYNYEHATTRRSIYHPVFRNSLPELLEAFDFADSSVSIGQRSRSTVATQALALLNDPWIAKRAAAAARRFVEDTERGANAKAASQDALIERLYIACLQRLPTEAERLFCSEFLSGGDWKPGSADSSRTNDLPSQQRVEILVHSLFASIDFRYLD